MSVHGSCRPRSWESCRYPLPCRLLHEQPALLSLRLCEEAWLALAVAAVCSVLEEQRLQHHFTFPEMAYKTGVTRIHILFAFFSGLAWQLHTYKCWHSDSFLIPRNTATFHLHPRDAWVVLKILALFDKSQALRGAQHTQGRALNVTGLLAVEPLPLLNQPKRKLVCCLGPCFPAFSPLPRALLASSLDNRQASESGGSLPYPCANVSSCRASETDGTRCVLLIQPLKYKL